MHILITRPEPDAFKLKMQLEELDHEATVEPLMAADFEGGEAVELAEVQALIATSRNGLRGLQQQGAHDVAAKLPIFTVGPGTAAEARRLGFELILVGKGGVRDLVPEIVANLDPQAGFLLQLAGDELAADIAPDLQSFGFRLLQPVVYRMRSTETLSVTTRDKIADGELDAVILLSPRTAGIWVDLVRQHDLVRPARRMRHLCLSPAVAARAKTLGDIQVDVAERPTLQEMLALIT